MSAVRLTAGGRDALWGALLATGAGLLITFTSVEILLLLAVGMLVIGILYSPIAALGALFSLAPLRALIATEAPALFPLDVGQVMFGLLLIAWLIDMQMRRVSLRRLLFPSPVLLCLLPFLLVSGLSLFTAWSAHHWLTEWIKWVQIALLIIIIRDLGERYGVRWLVFSLMLAAAIHALIGIYQFYGGSGALHLLVEGRYFRAFGTFGQPNPFGGFMGIIAPLAVAAAFSQLIMAIRQRTAGQWALCALYALFAGLIAFALYLSWSRGAWLGLAAACAVMFVLIPRRWGVSVLLVAGTGVIIGGALMSGRVPASITSRLSSITLEITSAGDVRGTDITPENYANVERLAHWQAALDMAHYALPLGVGFGNYEIAYPRFALLNWEMALGHAHNYYLNVFAETGMIGFICYAVMMIGFVVVLLRLRQHPGDGERLIATGILGSLVYLAVHSLTDNLYVNNLYLHIGALLGLTALLHDRLNRTIHG
jgi:O-antigen ligase